MAQSGERTMTDAGGHPARPAASPEDRRRYKRQRVLWTAKLYQRGVIHECVVANVSAGGARMIMEIQFGAPDPGIEHGALAMLTIDRFGDFPGRVVWHEERYIGLEFLQPADEVFAIIGSQLPPPPPETGG